MDCRGRGAGTDPRQRLLVFLVKDSAMPLPVVAGVLPMVAVSPVPECPSVVLGVVSLHGHLVPVLDIRGRLGLPSREYGLTAHLVVVRTHRRRTLALAVDEALGVTEVAAEAIMPPDAVLPGIGRVAGIVALADGPLLIEDVEVFLSVDEERRLDHALEEPPE